MRHQPPAAAFGGGRLNAVLASIQLNNVSSGSIDPLRSSSRPPDSAVELSTEAHKPVLKRFDEILGSKAFNNLGLR
jgi:hypothetical protein